MKLSRQTKSGSKQDGSIPSAKLHLSTWLRITSLILVLALAGSVALGAPLHSSERGCNMPLETPACEQMIPSAPGVANIQLCCLLDCQEPGSTTSVSVQIPSFNAAPIHQIAPRPAFALAKPLSQPDWRQSSSFTPPVTYLKNLALLI